tara:strand:+ start:178 stop:603 length:426 start_codon:yes stop_codon:yes gene_type:complete
MIYLKSWITFGEKMEIGECEEVYYWEHAIYPGYTEDICFLLRKLDKENFSLSLATPRRLSLIEDIEVEDEDDPFVDTIDGEDVRKQLGEYYIGYDYDSYPDPDVDNQVTFNKFDEAKINLWFKKNKTRFLLEDIEPGVNTI